MGIYWFAVDYVNRLQMWAPSKYSNKSPAVYYPTHPLPSWNILNIEFQIHILSHKLKRVHIF